MALLLKKGGGIHIKPENKGKFTATKKRTGKTTEELTHSKNPITKKRAIFAQNAKKWKKKGRKKKEWGGILFKCGNKIKNCGGVMKAQQGLKLISSYSGLGAPAKTLVSRMATGDVYNQYLNDYIDAYRSNPSKFNQDIPEEVIRAKYSDPEKLFTATQDLKKRAEISNRIAELYQEKASMLENPYYGNEIEEIRNAQKTNWGKDTDNIKYVKSSVPGFHLTPVHNNIKEDIFNAAKKLGQDPYEALALAIVESNAGATKESDRHSGDLIFTAHNATGYDEPIMKYRHNSRYNAAMRSMAHYLQKNKQKLPRFITDPSAQNKIIDTDALTLDQYQQYADQYTKFLQDQYPVVGSTVEAALKFYFDKPEGYNSGNKNYVNTVRSLARTLKSQGF